MSRWAKRDAEKREGEGSCKRWGKAVKGRGDLGVVERPVALRRRWARCPLPFPLQVPAQVIRMLWHCVPIFINSKALRPLSCC